MKNPIGYFTRTFQKMLYNYVDGLERSILLHIVGTMNSLIGWGGFDAKNNMLKKA